VIQDTRHLAKHLENLGWKALYVGLALWSGKDDDEAARLLEEVRDNIRRVEAFLPPAGEVPCGTTPR
jgi:hypothetical protein